MDNMLMMQPVNMVCLHVLGKCIVNKFNKPSLTIVFAGQYASDKAHEYGASAKATLSERAGEYGIFL